MELEKLCLATVLFPPFLRANIYVPSMIDVDSFRSLVARYHSDPPHHQHVYILDCSRWGVT